MGGGRPSEPGPRSWAARLFDRDPSLWSSDPPSRPGSPSASAGSTRPAHFREQIPALEGFGEALRADGFKAAVVAGMGGSSLAPEVLQRDLRGDPGLARPARPRFDRSGRRRRRRRRPRSRSRPCSSWPASPGPRPSRSRSRPMPGLGSRRRSTLRHEHRESPARLMAAITDPGKSIAGDPPPRRAARGLPQPARHRRPLLGADLCRARAGEPHRPVARRPARGRRSACSSAAASPSRPRTRAWPWASPWVPLALAAPAGAGRDKVTFIADPEIASLGSWLEQLIAESTGKQGVGIVPVDLEPLGAPAGLRAGPGLRPARPGRLGRSRCRRRRDDAPTPSSSSSPAAGHPVIRIELADRSTSAASSCAGRSPRRSPGPSSASTRSTSPTSRRPRS